MRIAPSIPITASSKRMHHPEGMAAPSGVVDERLTTKHPSTGYQPKALGLSPAFEAWVADGSNRKEPTDPEDDEGKDGGSFKRPRPNESRMFRELNEGRARDGLPALPPAYGFIENAKPAPPAPGGNTPKAMVTPPRGNKKMIAINDMMKSPAITGV